MREVQGLIVLMQTDVEGQSDDEMMEKEDLLRFVTENEVVPILVSYVPVPCIDRVP